jgi:hypothetical protein
LDETFTEISLSKFCRHDLFLRVLAVYLVVNKDLLTCKSRAAPRYRDCRPGQKSLLVGVKTSNMRGWPLALQLRYGGVAGIRVILSNTDRLI